MNAFSRQLYENLTKVERDKVQEYILFLISQRPKSEENNKYKMLFFENIVLLNKFIMWYTKEELIWQRKNFTLYAKEKQ